MRSSVDLPDPDVPTMTVTDPRSIDIETASTTVVAPYCLVRESIWIIEGPFS